GDEGRIQSDLRSIAVKKRSGRSHTRNEHGQQWKSEDGVGLDVESMEGNYPSIFVARRGTPARKPADRVHSRAPRSRNALGNAANRTVCARAWRPDRQSGGPAGPSRAEGDLRQWMASCRGRQ